MGDYGIWRDCVCLARILWMIGIIQLIVFLFIGFYWVGIILGLVFLFIGLFFWWVWRPPKDIRDYYKNEGY